MLIMLVYSFLKTRSSSQLSYAAHILLKHLKKVNLLLHCNKAVLVHIYECII